MKLQPHIPIALTNGDKPLSYDGIDLELEERCNYSVTESEKATKLLRQKIQSIKHRTPKEGN